MQTTGSSTRMMSSAMQPLSTTRRLITSPSTSRSCRSSERGRVLLTRAQTSADGCSQVKQHMISYACPEPVWVN